jgi:hypothetical protein
MGPGIGSATSEWDNFVRGAKETQCLRSKSNPLIPFTRDIAVDCGNRRKHVRTLTCTGRTSSGRTGPYVHSGSVRVSPSLRIAAQARTPSPHEL